MAVDVDNLLRRFDVKDITQDHFGIRDNSSNGVHGIARLHRATNHFRQQRIEQDVGLIVNQGQVDIRVLTNESFYFHGGVNSGHGAAHDHNVGCFIVRFWHGEMTRTVE